MTTSGFAKMKSMSLLFLAVAGLALWAGAAGLQSSGKTILVSQSVSAQSWTRTCAYAAPEGVRSLEVDADEACPATPGREGATRQARLAD